jgi:hypothetical protein
MQDVKDRLANRVQLTTDGHRPYLDATEDAFGGDVDYAMLVKLYGGSGEGALGSTEQRYSPARVIGTRYVRIRRKVSRPREARRQLRRQDFEGSQAFRAACPATDQARWSAAVAVDVGWEPFCSASRTKPFHHHRRPPPHLLHSWTDED